MDQQDIEAARSRKERVRLQLFGYIRDKDGKIVEPQPTQVEAAIRDSLGFAASESNSNNRIEAIRERLFGYRRDPTGKILGPEPSEKVEKARLELFGYSRDRSGEIVKPEPIDLEKRWSELQERLYGSTTAREPLQFTYQAEIQPYERAGRKFAKVFLINERMNKAGWGVTQEAMRKALALALTNLPLLGPPERAHQPGAFKVGELIDFQGDGEAYGLFEIVNDEAWQKIKNREWRYVSPRITAHEVERLPNGQELIKDFSFDHIAFCLNPAYPEVGDGVITTYGGDA